jgi:hypothetical protein
MSVTDSARVNTAFGVVKQKGGPEFEGAFWFRLPPMHGQVVVLFGRPTALDVENSDLDSSFLA